jgi:endonuclease/exonuclease/phosphatase family metal-dependent hydrolase
VAVSDDGHRREGIFRAVSYNLFKGRHWMHLRSALPKMGAQLRAADPDVLMLQEIRGFEGSYASEGEEFSKGIELPHFAYGKNFVGKEKNHGNAIYSRFPLYEYENVDLSLKSYERRGILSCSVNVGPNDKHLHLFTTHLDLGEESRRKQLDLITKAIERIVRSDAVILAGDFNDWRLTGHAYLRERLGLREAFEDLTGVPARTFPSFHPLLRLDRMYYRGLEPVKGHVCMDGFRTLSDHLPISVDFKVT